MNRYMCVVFAVVMVWACFPADSMAGTQNLWDSDLAKKIDTLKNDPRGPFQEINWFCPDGKIQSAQTPCPKDEGVQHGRVKEWVLALEQEKGIYLDTVLAGTSPDLAWDMATRYSRLKQYALLQYLISADDGWIYRKARFYRGAVQAEDENKWGGAFLHRILALPQTCTKDYFIAREACRVIPHVNRNKTRLQSIRSVSKAIAEKDPGFMALRIKIHGQPEAGDLEMVKKYRDENGARMDAEQTQLFKTLLGDLDAEYKILPADLLDAVLTRDSLKNKRFSVMIARVKETRDALGSLNFSPDNYEPNPYADMADLLIKIRKELPGVPENIRLPLIDASLELENVLMMTVSNWHPETLGQLLAKNLVLAKAAAGCGYIESWEWDTFNEYKPLSREKEDDFIGVRLKAEQVRRVVDWGTTMVTAVYGSEISLFSTFASQARGFSDDRIRSSILLALGRSAGALSQAIQKISGMTHMVPDGVETGGLRGMNPGLAFGTLSLVEDGKKPMEMESKNIYLFRNIPSDLKPVAGVMSVSEGNPVSHVQLLARNLGIPNAAVTESVFDQLSALAGQKILFAVSQRGRVVIKTQTQMTEQEKALVNNKERGTELFTVPVDRINLDQVHPVLLSAARAKDSGRICGPKAANLGQLKFQFPGTVGEGIILPFGLFKKHMDQPMPDSDGTYWQYLTRVLAAPDQDEAGRINALATLQNAIKTMPFLPGFEKELNTLFMEALGNELGEVPVFIRSDTNMEDIKDFTGAGLNLTLFNIREKKRILAGIREVWASPYSERSYLWRQKYLSNPANVFPSILLLPSVNVQRSGVIITHGLFSGNPSGITVAFCRGVAGAVDGQTAENYLLTVKDEDILLQPARETNATTTPSQGGVVKAWVDLDEPVLNALDRQKIRELVARVRNTLPGTPGIEGQGPFDIEMGFFNDEIRLFQVRPFMENKRAGMTNYLLRLDMGYKEPDTISLQRPL
ncbi:PEP/pyruvate-binding domain-containing protein [uncultured Desulfobacter sp.]|uniref:PEP/pyruvate-binding domain-containing protein n=1 Tax=uncultured Desulfobacter sp. TaxID=240139 RepID=UPI002AABBF0A|nr:PEP/pyruvate-binding domain-containing protein [uncultured Desulfobacter sp.]